jgi:hypothetical protein
VTAADDANLRARATPDTPKPAAPISAEHLAELRRKAEAATSWLSDQGEVLISGAQRVGLTLAFANTGDSDKRALYQANAAHIAAAAPAETIRLLDYVAALEAEREIDRKGFAALQEVCRDWQERSNAAEARLSAAQAELAEAREALKPFAAFAQPINGEAGRPSPLESSLQSTGGMEEFDITSAFGRGLGPIYAADFRRAHTVMTSGGERS